MQLPFSVTEIVYAREDDGVDLPHGRGFFELRPGKAYPVVEPGDMTKKDGIDRPFASRLVEEGVCKPAPRAAKAPAVAAAATAETPDAK